MRSVNKLSLALLALDILFALTLFNFAIYLRGIGPGTGWVVEPLLAPVIFTLIGIYLIDGYSPRTDLISLDYTSQHILALLTAMLAVLLLTFVIVPNGFELQSSRGVTVVGFLALIPTTLLTRRTVYLAALRARGIQSYVFIGDPESARTFQIECRRFGAEQPIIYATANSESVAPFSHSTAMPFRALDDVLSDIRAGRLNVGAIILRESNRELELHQSQELVKLHFEGIPTFTLELFHQLHWRKIPLYRLNQTWLFQEGFRVARDPVFERVKRASDILLSFLGLLLASPLIALGGLAVWLEDRGPVFFAQDRVGKNHAPFRIYKLRTMRPSTGGPGDLYTRKGDSRITRVGQFLRVTRIDEFPQMWNVLRGDMSLIGPRAEWDRLVATYERDIPCYHFRHLVKPGITGWAQVNYPYGANLEDTQRKLEYDLYYIRHFSFVLDASIVLKTIHIMLFGKGR